MVMKGDWRWVGEMRHGDYVVSSWKGERLLTFNMMVGLLGRRYSTDRAVRVRHTEGGCVAA